MGIKLLLAVTVTAQVELEVDTDCAIHNMEQFRRVVMNNFVEWMEHPADPELIDSIRIIEINDSDGERLIGAEIFGEIQ